MLVELEVPESLPVLDELAPAVSEAVGVFDKERERLSVLVGVRDDVCVPEEVGEPEGEPLSLCVDVVDGAPLWLGVTDALAPLDRDNVGVPESDEDSVIVELGVDVGVPLVDAVGDPVGVSDGETDALTVEDAVLVGVTVAETDTEGVPLALPPMDSVVVGVSDVVVEELCVVDPLSLEVPVPDWVDDVVLVPEPVALLVGDGVAVVLGVSLELAQRVIEDVAVSLSGLVAKEDADEVGVAERDVEERMDGGCVDVSLVVPFALPPEPDTEQVNELVILGAAGGVVDGVGEAVTDAVPGIVAEGVTVLSDSCDDIALVDCESVSVGDTLGVGDTVPLLEDKALTVLDDVKEDVLDAVSLDDIVALTLKVSLLDGEPLPVRVVVSDIDAVALNVTVALALGDAVLEIVRVEDTERVADRVTDGVGERLALAPALTVAVGDAVALGVLLGGHAARRTLNAPSSVMTIELVAGSHATPIGAVSVAPRPTPSANPEPEPPTIVETTPASLTARTAALPVSATKMYFPSKQSPPVVNEKEASAPMPSSNPNEPAPASVETAPEERSMRRRRLFPASITYANSAPSVVTPLGLEKHAAVPTPSANAARPHPAMDATAPSAVTARTALFPVSVTINVPDPSTARCHGDEKDAAFGYGELASTMPAEPVPARTDNMPCEVTRRNRCIPDSTNTNPPATSSATTPVGHLISIL